MPLPGGLLDTLLFLGVLHRLLVVLWGLLSSLLLWLLLLVLLLGMLRLLLFRLALLLRMLLWLLLFRLALLLRMLLWLLLFRLALLLSVLRLRLSMRLFLLLFWLGLLFPLLSEGWNYRPKGHNQDCGSESCKCFHGYYLSTSVGADAANSCILLTIACWAQVGPP
jgi:hypothetical protein